jgi:hypothetical protein
VARQETADACSLGRRFRFSCCGCGALTASPALMLPECGDGRIVARLFQREAIMNDREKADEAGPLDEATGGDTRKLGSAPDTVIEEEISVEVVTGGDTR